MNILIAEPEHYSTRALGIYRSLGEVRLGLDEGAPLAEQVSDVDILVIRLRYRVGREVIASAPNLRVVVTPTTGLDHLDLEALEEHGVQVLSLKGETGFLRSIPATAELTWGLLLAVRRRIVPAVSSVAQGEWERDYFRGRDLKGCVMGIVGCGRIGSMIAEYAKVFGMSVLVFDRSPIDLAGVEQVSLDELYQKSDVVSIHLPLEAETVGFVGPAAFARIKEGAVFLNTSRSGIVDEDALMEALRSGRLAGAAVDVVSGEETFSGRIPEGHALVDFAKNSDNLIITPHIGGASWDSMHATEDFCAERLLALFQSETAQ